MQSIKTLQTICAQSEVAQCTRDNAEIVGVICAIAAAPDEFDLADWLPLLAADGQALSFAQEQSATEFANAVIACFQKFCEVFNSAITLDISILLTIDQDKPSESCTEFAKGFLTAFNSTEQSWQTLQLEEGSEQDQMLQTTLLLLNKLAAPDEQDLQLQALYKQLPSYQECINSLPLLLTHLGHFSQQVKAQYAEQ